MKKGKKIVCILLAAMLLTTMMSPIYVGAQVNETTKGGKADFAGDCGKKARWNYDADTQTLIISGTGKISVKIENREIKENVKKLIIGEGINEIGESVFYGFGFSEVALPESLKKIGDSAFYACNYLEKITIPKNVKKIGGSAFGENVKLSQITILGNITSPYSFIDEGCTITLKLAGFCKPMGIMSVYNKITVKLLKGNKSYIRKKGFILSPDKKHLYLYTGKKNKIKIPNSIEIVEPGAVSWKKVVRMGKNIQQIKKWGFYYCDFDKLKLPKHLKRIEAGAFSRSDMNELKMNDELKYIGAGAFNDTSLKYVTINHDLIIKENNFPSSTLKYEEGTKKKTTIQQAYYWDRKKKKDKILVRFLQVENVDGYEIKLTQPGRKVEKIFDTESDNVKYKWDKVSEQMTPAIFVSNFKVKTKKGQWGNADYKSGYAIYTRVRPYNYVNGKKIYGSWSSKYKLGIDDGFWFE